MIQEIKRGIKKGIRRQVATGGSVRSAQVNAVLANGQAQIRDVTGRLSYVTVQRSQDLRISQSVYVMGGYVVGSRGPVYFPPLEEFEV